MSRCFPYPPRGYSLKSAGDEALVESIKLQRERENAKAERKKEKKREKKEKKRERGGRKKQDPSEIGLVEERKLNDEKIRKVEKSRFDLGGGCIQKRREDEDEQLESSGLTEEHEQPCSQYPCYSSDSTQNINKRRKHAFPLNGSNNRGNIIRIRLPVQNHKQPDTLISKEWHNSTSGRTDLPAHLMETNAVLQDLTPRTGKEPRSVSGRTGVFAEDDRQTASMSTLFENEMQRAESLYKGLIENWIPPALQGELTDFDDQEWLFGNKQRDRPEGKRFRAGNDFSNSNSTLWPRAQHLPDADIYALPFTVPF
ncbi:hypothetical protein F0562_027108 [Nyssa sinensis]|uniref:Uncharacterized protein n=1 Tax=Nyssa sinensis TaxID=561372 RepID=A0A5J5B4G2_9ASTE|nr:hypothetical protein F0562_027108 [Nyssa sinensis]